MEIKSAKCMHCSYVLSLIINFVCAIINDTLLCLFSDAGDGLQVHKILIPTEVEALSRGKCQYYIYLIKPGLPEYEIDSTDFMWEHFEHISEVFPKPGMVFRVLKLQECVAGGNCVLISQHELPNIIIFTLKEHTKSSTPAWCFQI